MSAPATELVKIDGLKARVETHLDETIFTVERNDYRKLCEALRAVGFDFPRCLTGTDMGYGLRSSLHLQRMQDKRKAVVHTDAPYNDPHIATVSDIWGGVEWHERESYDLVGIIYDHHPDQLDGHPRRLLLEDDWTIHPLQKRYDTRGYLMQDWQGRAWPSPAPHEQGFAMFPVAAPVKPAAPVAKVAAPVASATPASASATPASAGAAPTPDAAEAAPKKVPKRFVPAGQVAETKTETVAPAEVKVEAEKIATVNPETSVPVAEVVKPVEATEANPKIKRWEPKGAAPVAATSAAPVAAAVVAAEVIANIPAPVAEKIEAQKTETVASEVAAEKPVAEKQIAELVVQPVSAAEKIVEKAEAPIAAAVVPEPVKTEITKTEAVVAEPEKVVEAVKITEPVKPEAVVETPIAVVSQETKVETPAPVVAEPLVAEPVISGPVKVVEAVRAESVIETPVPVVEPVKIVEPVKTEVVAESGNTETVQASKRVGDDLEIIEGIGPRRATVLVEAGVDTFVKLSQSSAANLSSIMEKAGLSLEPGIDTWPIQAEFLVKGDQAGFKAFTDALTGGKLKKKNKNKKEGA